MAVYTSLNLTSAGRLLHDYPIGVIKHINGIQQGVTNSNFLLDTQNGSFVLTLYEDHSNIDCMIDLLTSMEKNVNKSVCMVRDRQGNTFGKYQGRNFILYRFCSGKSPKFPSADEQRQLARWLARFHNSCQHLSLKPYAKDGAWRRRVAAECLPLLKSQQQQFLQAALHRRGVYEFSDLPHGVIHGDLFRDNVLFQDGELQVVLDFENTGNAPLLLDLAIVVNDWCNSPDGLLDLPAMAAFLREYDAYRKLSSIERDAWPMMLHRGALRFYLSRLHARLFPRQGEHHPRPVEEYEARLREIEQRETEIRRCCRQRI